MKQALLVALVVLAACGSKSKGTDGPPEGDGVPDGALQPGQWDTLDKETRAKWMGKVVKPHMAELFQTHDAAEFSELDCETCHGVESVASGSFEMPSAELPALSADMIAKPADDMKAITEFMMTKVRPSMASFLGRPEWSPQQPDGFGCFGCHPHTPPAPVENAATEDSDIEPDQPATTSAPAWIKFLVDPSDAAIRIVGTDPHVGTPYKVQVDPGIYQVEIRRDGFKLYVTSVEIEAGTTQTIRVLLEKASP